MTTEVRAKFDIKLTEANGKYSVAGIINRDSSMISKKDSLCSYSITFMQYFICSTLPKI